MSEESQQPSGEKEKRTYPPNNIFVGKKPVMVYALSAQLQLTQYDEVVLRARGRAISKAVDVEQVLVNRIGANLYQTKSIKTGTEVLGEGDQKHPVSTIEIVVVKKK